MSHLLTAALWTAAHVYKIVPDHVLPRLLNIIEGVSERSEVTLNSDSECCLQVTVVSESFLVDCRYGARVPLGGTEVDAHLGNDQPMIHIPRTLISSKQTAELEILTMACEEVI